MKDHITVFLLVQDILELGKIEVFAAFWMPFAFFFGISDLRLPFPVTIERKVLRRHKQEIFEPLLALEIPSAFEHPKESLVHDVLSFLFAFEDVEGNVIDEVTVFPVDEVKRGIHFLFKRGTEFP